MDFITDKNIIQKITAYISLVKKRFDVEKVYLFGSCADGKMTRDSDIDLAIVSESFTNNKFESGVILGKMTWGIDTRIEPIAFTPQEFEEQFFAQEIKMKGIEIPIN
ncbi:MAG: nucleotidyltransferase domain-containing protein [Melioribacteraceae bacterium]